LFYTLNKSIIMHELGILSFRGVTVRLSTVYSRGLRCLGLLE